MNNLVTNLSTRNSLVMQWMMELRSSDLQQDRMRFRRNLERIGMVAAYEISKDMDFEEIQTNTPMGVHNSQRITQQPVIATILRAGMPMHNGMMEFFDGADAAFVAAYRKHHKDGTFTVAQEYVTTPPLEGRTLIIADPMIATGSSLVVALNALCAEYQPQNIIAVTAIATTQGIEYVHRHLPEVHIYTGDIDEELTAKGYIVPGLGDAGDLCYGSKDQN